MTRPTYCSSCGAALPAEGRFCSHCGSVIDTPAPDSAPAVIPASGIGRPKLALVACVAVVASAVLAFVLLSGGGSNGSTQSGALGLKIDTFDDWKSQTVHGVYVSAENGSDLDPAKAPTGPRLTIQKTAPDAHGVSGLVKDPGGDLSQTFDIVEDPRNVAVGSSYGVAIATWSEEGTGPAVIRRSVIVPAVGHLVYIIGEEIPAEQWKDYVPIFDSFLSRAEIKDAAINGPPPRDQSGPPGPGWPLVFRDTFGPGTTAWPMSREINLATITGTQSVRGGKYVIEGNQTAAPGGGASWDRSDATYKDFYLSLEVQNLGTTRTISGLRFRGNKLNSEMYTLILLDNGGWRLVYRDPSDKDSELAAAANSTAFKPGQVNKLSVLANGAHIVAWINDQKVAELDHPSGPSSGTVGFVYQPTASGPFTLAFDNFELHAPSP